MTSPLYQAILRLARQGAPRRYMMSDGEALLRAAFDRPGDVTPHLVYADWADDHGMPHTAAFVRGVHRGDYGDGLRRGGWPPDIAAQAPHTPRPGATVGDLAMLFSGDQRNADPSRAALAAGRPVVSVGGELPYTRRDRGGTHYGHNVSLILPDPDAPGSRAIHFQSHLLPAETARRLVAGLITEGAHPHDYTARSMADPSG